MFIPAWPSLVPSALIRAETTAHAPFPISSSQSAYYYVARYGIYHLFRNLGFGPDDVVLVPDYHHGNEIAAIKAARVAIRYYPIDHALNADMEALRRLLRDRPRALYVTHFIGFPQPIAEISAMCKENDVLLIEDCALAFMSACEGRPLGGFGDYSVFCLYKSLPVPNGGVMVANRTEGKHVSERPLVRPTRVSVASRGAELLIQWIRMRHEPTGGMLMALKRGAGSAISRAGVERLPVGDSGFDENAANVRMSPLSARLLRHFDYGRILETRRRNYQHLKEALQSYISMLPRDLAPGVCPLFFPLLVRHKEQAQRALWRHGIETVQFWNEGDRAAERKGSAAAFLRRHVLEVPIHQDLSFDHLEFTARQILDLRLGLDTNGDGAGEGV